MLNTAVGNVAQSLGIVLPALLPHVTQPGLHALALLQVETEDGSTEVGYPGLRAQLLGLLFGPRYSCFTRRRRGTSCGLSCWANCREGKKEGHEPGTSSKSLGSMSDSVFCTCCLFCCFEKEQGWELCKSQFDGNEDSVYQLHKTGAAKMSEQTLHPSPDVEIVGPSPSIVRGEFSILPC